METSSARPARAFRAWRTWSPLWEDGRIHRPFMIDWEHRCRDLVVTFDGLVTSTPFVTRMRALLRLLQEKLGGPVDIEFASDGRDLYLLQCRPQSFFDESLGTADPRGRARRSGSSSRRTGSSRTARSPTSPTSSTSIPRATARSPDLEALRRVGRAVGRLNKILPKRQFVLIGPGRWGSRGDVRLGVPVTYSDINNASVLIEVAQAEGQLRPRPLVRHPLLPGPRRGEHPLPAALPGRPRRRLQRTVPPRVPERPRRPRSRLRRPRGNRARDRRRRQPTGGLVLKILMNADLDKALGMLAPPQTAAERAATKRRVPGDGAAPPEDHWRWRAADGRADRRRGRRGGVRRQGHVAVRILQERDTPVPRATSTSSSTWTTTRGRGRRSRPGSTAGASACPR